MKQIKKLRARSKGSYFYITEEPPICLDTPTRVGKQKPLSSRANPYFFIDFTQNGSLRQMTKIDASSIQDSERLKIQQYGKNIITNVEDSSPGEQKLLKFQEQLIKLRQRKNEIRSKISHQLQRSKERRRINSQLTIKQKIIDELTFPVATYKSQGDSRLRVSSGRPQATSTRWQGRHKVVLRRLGLLHEHSTIVR